MCAKLKCLTDIQRRERFSRTLVSMDPLRLRAEPRDMNIQRAGVAGVIGFPNFFEERIALHHFAGFFHQHFKKRDQTRSSTWCFCQDISRGGVPHRVESVQHAPCSFHRPAKAV